MDGHAFHVFVTKCLLSGILESLAERCLFLFFPDSQYLWYPYFSCSSIDGDHTVAQNPN